MPIPHNIRIYDDCSGEYDIQKLRDLFPTAVSIKRNEQNIKADKNMYNMYTDFLSTNDEYFFNGDSDLIFHSNWLVKAFALMPETEGILSIFNANSHIPLRRINENMCIKDTVGAAGTLFARERIEQLIQEFPSIDMVKGFDWQWSKFFTERGMKIYCTNNSLVQHIGYTGQNTLYFFDFGRGFEIENAKEGQIINNIFELFMDTVSSQYQKEKEAENKRNEELANNYYYHLKRCIVIILKHLLPKKFIEKIKKRKNRRSSIRP
jgi:hypothetical protein